MPARWRCKSSSSSMEMRTLTEAAKPCLRAFWLDVALPSGVMGPLDWAPLRRDCSERVSFGMVSGMVLGETFHLDTKVEVGGLAVNSVKRAGC